MVPSRPPASSPRAARSFRAARSRLVALAGLLALSGVLALARPPKGLAWEAGLGAPAGRCVVSLRPAGDVPLDGSVALDHPRAIAVDHRKRILLADTGNDRVVVLSAAGDLVSEFGGYGWEEGRFDEPADLAVYPGFYVYVLDRGNRRVQRFDADGDRLDTAVTADEVSDPVAVEVGRAGEILVLDADVQSVRLFSQFGEPEDPVGRFGVGGGGLVLPRDVAQGPRGEVAVADVGRAAVLVYDEFGALDRTLGLADTLLPSAVVFDRLGNLIVADELHGTVTAFSPGGVPTARIDSDAAGGAIRPAALAVTSDGEVLILESAPPRILRVEAGYGECGAPR